MVEVVAFKAEHVIYLERQQHEGTKEEDCIRMSQYKLVEELGRAKTIVVNGKIIACAGVIPYNSWRGAVWAIIDRNANRNFIPLVRTLRRLLDEAPETRIESTVVASFEKGHKLNRILGFTLEAPLMKKYGELGTTYSLYSRVK